MIVEFHLTSKFLCPFLVQLLFPKLMTAYDILYVTYECQICVVFFCNFTRVTNIFTYKFYC